MRPTFEPTTGDWHCEHGTALDVHCCHCHSGFLFDPDGCICDQIDPHSDITGRTIRTWLGFAVALAAVVAVMAAFQARNWLAAGAAVLIGVYGAWQAAQSV